MYEKILERYKDELEDVILYAGMSKEAENDTQKCILKDIAKEECEHASMLKHILEKHGGYKSDDMLKELEGKSEKALSEL